MNRASLASDLCQLNLSNPYLIFEERTSVLHDQGVKVYRRSATSMPPSKDYEPSQSLTLLEWCRALPSVTPEHDERYTWKTYDYPFS